MQPPQPRQQPGQNVRLHEADRAERDGEAAADTLGVFLAEVRHPTTVPVNLGGHHLTVLGHWLAPDDHQVAVADRRPGHRVAPNAEHEHSPVTDQPTGQPDHLLGQEWGDPRIREQFDWLRAYSPYDNLPPAPKASLLSGLVPVAASSADARLADPRLAGRPRWCITRDGGRSHEVPATLLVSPLRRRAPRNFQELRRPRRCRGTRSRAGFISRGLVDDQLRQPSRSRPRCCVGVSHEGLFRSSF
jgi:hypothetical protein